MSKLLNTHYYDTQLRDQYKRLSERQNNNTDFLSIPWTIDMVFGEMYSSLDKLNMDNTVRQMLDLLKRDNSSNYDQLNDIHTIDILTRTWYYVRKLPIEDHKMLFEQIGEIKNGTCAQGRTTRLFQIYYSFF
jgi:hypothetical protein